jgi:hypothetical protein
MDECAPQLATNDAGWLTGCNRVDRRPCSLAIAGVIRRMHRWRKILHQAGREHEIDAYEGFRRWKLESQEAYHPTSRACRKREDDRGCGLLRILLPDMAGSLHSFLPCDLSLGLALHVRPLGCSLIIAMGASARCVSCPAMTCLIR